MTSCPSGPPCTDSNSIRNFSIGAKAALTSSVLTLSVTSFSQTNLALFQYLHHLSALFHKANMFSFLVIRIALLSEKFVFRQFVQLLLAFEFPRQCVRRPDCLYPNLSQWAANRAQTAQIEPSGVAQKSGFLIYQKIL